MKVLSCKLSTRRHNRLVEHATGPSRMEDMSFTGSPHPTLRVRFTDEARGRRFVVEIDALEVQRMNDKFKELVAHGSAAAAAAATK